MLCKILVLVLIVAISMADQTLEQKWQKYKQDFNRNYGAEEDAQRLEIFKQNLQEIETHNENFKAGKVTWEMGLNKFSDRTPEEMKHVNGYKPKPGFAGVA